MNFGFHATIGFFIGQWTYFFCRNKAPKQIMDELEERPALFVVEILRGTNSDQSTIEVVKSDCKQEEP
jgi:hypothetical protein